MSQTKMERFDRNVTGKSELALHYFEKEGDFLFSIIKCGLLWDYGGL